MCICSNPNCRNIVFIGLKDNGFKFCNQLCHREGYVVVVSNEIPKYKVIEQVKKIHKSKCPKCKTKSQIDVYTSYRIFSCIISFRWIFSDVSCRTCAVRRQLGDLLFSLFFGWFGHLGFIYTPAFVLGNFIELIKNNDQFNPSIKLENFVKQEIANQLYNERILFQLSEKV